MGASEQHAGTTVAGSADPNTVLAIIYFVTIGAIVLGTGVYFFVMARIADPEVRLMDLMVTQRE
ncbi:hypothetical protein IWW47_003891, partial [Coemansia sp. RSA 2052]